MLGRTGMSVSEIGLGTWSFASRAYGDVDQKDAEAVVQTALDGGITLFDTAPLYGTSDEDGISERILGGALGTRRDGGPGRLVSGRLAHSGRRPRQGAPVCGALNLQGLRSVTCMHPPSGMT